MVNVRNTRIPRGYDIARPYYEEVCEGVRPTVQAVPLEAWTGLSPTRIDDVHHDPVVIEPGTIVGIATGGVFSGKIVPAHYAGPGITGTHTLSQPTLSGYAHTDGATWGISTTDGANAGGFVRPIGVVYQPIYSFMLQAFFTNYKRNENLGVVTDYVIQIPAITDEETLIKSGDLVMVGSGVSQGSITPANGFAAKRLAGRFRRYDATQTGNSWPANSALAVDWVVGRCLKSMPIAITTGSANTRLKEEIVAGRVSLTAEATNEFKNLAKVQTAPAGGTAVGNPLAGSGSAGLPGWLLGAVCDSGKVFYSLTILVRL